jgi:hypothetical protein
MDCSWNKSSVLRVLSSSCPLVLCFLYASPGLFLILVLTVIGLSLREYFHLLQHVSIPVCPYVPAGSLCTGHDGVSERWRCALAIAHVVSQYGGADLSVMLTASQAAHFLPLLV